MSEVYRKTVEFIRQRQLAYKLTILKSTKVVWAFCKKRAYRLIFDLRQPANVVVLADLAGFCRANESCVVPGDRDKSLVLEGRREVFLRIQQHLGLTTEQAFALYSGGSPQQRNDE